MSVLAGNGALRLAAAAIVLLLALQATLAFTHAINWDEFWFYSQVAEFNRGELTKPLQTLHVRLFQFLPGLTGNAVADIVAGRIFMLGFELVTLFAIRHLALQFGTQLEAWLAVLLYLSAGYVFQHGYAFRTDPMVTAALMLALSLLAMPGRSWIRLACVSVLGGLATAISIKAALYLPCFAGIGIMRIMQAEQRMREWIALLLCAVGIGCAFLLFFILHSNNLPAAAATQSAAIAKAGQTGAGAADHMFFWGKPPNLGMVVKGLMLAMPFTLLIALAPIAIARTQDHAPKIALAGLLAPIATLAFYRNTASYYFVFMLAPVAVACVLSLRLALTRISPPLLMAVLVSMNAGLFLLDNRDVIDRQKIVVGFANGALTPSAYFDHPHMLARFSKRNGFMMPAGMGTYRAAGIPAYRRAMEREPVPLLVENWWVMSEVIRGTDTSHMLPADVAALRQNFVEWHAPFWLAGKHIRPAQAAYNEEFLTPGRYQVESGTVEYDGKTYAQGEVIDIARGLHSIRADGSEPARLIWADRREFSHQPQMKGALWVPL